LLLACNAAESTPPVVVPTTPTSSVDPAVVVSGVNVDASAFAVGPPVLDAGSPAVRVAPRGPDRLSEGLSLAQRKQSFGACGSDADCVVTNFGGCCSNCGSSPYVRAKHEAEAAQHRCWTVDCAVNDRERCEPTEPASYYRAVCRDGACDGVRLPTAPR